MADNATPTGAGITVATDKVTYSGDSDTAHVQLFRSVKVTGAEGSKSIGSSTSHTVAGATTNATSIKGSAGEIHSVGVFNNTTYPVYVKFHNTAGTPTAGTGVVRTIGVQAGTGRQVIFPGGLPFSTGIGMTIVKLIADADATVVAASDCVVDVEYT